jgi:hypothetical protein
MPILSHEDSRLALGLQKYLRVADVKRQFRFVADADHIERFGPIQIVAENRLPEWAAQVFVRHKRERHPLPHLRFRGEWLLFRQPARKRIQIEPRCAVLLLVNGGGTGCDVRIDFRLVL